MPKTYIVKKGDNPWKIAKEHGIALDELLKLNPNASKVIYPGDELRLEPDKIQKTINIREEREREAKFNLDNVQAIQAAHHDSNYIIIDKKNRRLTVFDQNNNPLYTTDKISTGESGNDYNTITYTDSKGNIKNKQGNNSTPAGITVIDGVGTYHGYPTFIRSRINKDGSTENIASSLHFGNIGKERKVSNGCVRVAGKTLEDMSKLVGAGTMVYTLPEQEGSRFTIKGGALNFTADNPYGQNTGDKRFWDDYNVNIDKSYQPLTLKWKKTGNEEYDKNRKAFAQALVNNKQQLQKRFNLTSDEYNRFAEIALGLAEQESKFATAKRYKVKQTLGEDVISFLKNIKFDTSVNSRGATQMKLTADNKEMQAIYKELGITKDNIKDLDKSAIATLARLAQMYNTEVRGRKFIGANNTEVSPYDALLYKWNGHNDRLVNHTAIPSQNEYLNNVRRYGNNFDLYETRQYNKYKLGGNPYYKLFKASLRATRGINVDKDNTYDYKRYFNYSPADAMKLAAYNPNARFDNPNNHFTDKFKTPIHPTFSNQSIYSNSTTPGGNWLENQPVFVHSPYTAQHLDYTDDYLGYNVASGGPFEMSYYNGSYRIPTVEVVGKRKRHSLGGNKTYIGGLNKEIVITPNKNYMKSIVSEDPNVDYQFYSPTGNIVQTINSTPKWQQYWADREGSRVSNAMHKASPKVLDLLSAVDAVATGPEMLEGLYGLYNLGKKRIYAPHKISKTIDKIITESPIKTSSLTNSKIRTRIGDVEIDNPNLLYHLDRGDNIGAFSNHGAFVKEGKLFPGTPKDNGSISYSWWNKGKPYATHINGEPMTRLMTTTEDTPGMLHVRSQKYPIGQWDGKRGLVTKTEYVNSNPVDVEDFVYTLDPNYGYRKVVSNPSTIEWSNATMLPEKGGIGRRLESRGKRSR